MDPAEVRRLLEERKGSLERELTALTAAPRDPMAAVSFGKRVGDGTTEAISRIEQTSTAKTFAAKLADVDRALAKLDDGTYGACDRCGSAIGEERLEAVPWAVLCVRCASAPR